MLDFHPEALAELKSSLAWYSERSQRAASAFLASIRQGLASVEAAPANWPADEAGFRAIRVRKYPFQIFFRETAHGIRVMAVAHTARHPDYWRDRQ